MNKNLYQEIEEYMLDCMKDSAHDKEHIYRVLYRALDIAEYEENVDMEVLMISCLLHDIGREEQYQNPNVCHAKVGSEKAYDYLLKRGYNAEKAFQIKECIQSHRYRNDNNPSSIEAKILFDADKIDVTGTIGIARTLIYKGIVSEPMYSVSVEGMISDGTKDDEDSFFHEYKYKLEKMYDKFYTKRAEMIAKEKQQAAAIFYDSLLHEIKDCYDNGESRLLARLE